MLKIVPASQVKARLYTLTAYNSRDAPSVQNHFRRFHQALARRLSTNANNCGTTAGNMWRRERE